MLAGAVKFFYIYHISWVRAHLESPFFNKIAVTKLYKIGSFPTSNFTMNICTDFFHLQDSHRIVAYLSNDTCSLSVWGLVPEIWRSLIRVTGRNLPRERRRRRQRGTPLRVCRLVPVTQNCIFSCYPGFGVLYQRQTRLLDLHGSHLNTWTMMFSLSCTSQWFDHTEYAAPVWSPYMWKSAEQIEKVQRQVTKRIPGLRDLPYEQRLQTLKLPTLVYWRLRGDLINMYKFVHGNMTLNHAYQN